MNLPETLRAEGGLLGEAVTAEPGAPEFDRLADEAVREGYRLHYGEPRVVVTEDPDLALLAGDRLYALGLDRLADEGDLDSIAALAELISACAQAHVEGEPARAAQAWGRYCSRPVADGKKQAPSKYTAGRNMPGAFEGETVTRRRFMTGAAHGAGAMASMAFALPALGFAAGSAIFERPDVRWEPVGKPEDFPKDTYVPRIITTVENIGEIGKTTVYMRAHNEEIDGPQDSRIDDRFIAVSTRCMHLGCPVRYVDASQRFICPCHGGVYDFRGKVSGGPPVRPLDRFYTRVRNGQVEVGPRYSVNSEFKRFPSYRDPGQDLDGVGQYLFPGRFSTPKMD